jgi:CheY-like chemotaxis protein/anti-sigma regulatory factor (Ser/Thr protein kinase)
MGTILVVDDSKIDLKRATMLLEKREKSCAIITAGDGVEALKAIERERPNVVVTDLQMPNMTGLELVVEVRKRYPLIPVVLMTAAGNEEIAAEALAKGAASYVPKRELAADLANIVHRLLGLASEKQQKRRLLNSMTEASFELENDLKLLSAFVQELRESLPERGLFAHNDCLRITTAVDEALANAYFHGNLEVSSKLREQDATSFLELAEKRLQESPYNERKIFVQLHWERNLTLTIRDEGPGFDPSGLPDPLAPGFVERPCGRGLLLMRSFMDQVEYNRTGNQVTLVKKGQPLSQTTGKA